METLRRETDSTVYCVTATSFPTGIAEAFKKLHTAYPPNDDRIYYGLSWPDGNGSLVYKAAVGFAKNEAAPNDEFEPFVLKKGKYKGEVIRNFMQDVPSVGNLFQQLIQDPDIDPNGYCMEVYLNANDVFCLVKLKD